MFGTESVAFYVVPILFADVRSSWKALQSSFWRHFTWMRYFSFHSVGLAKQFLTLFHVDALLCTSLEKPCRAVFDAISRGCATFHLFGRASKATFDAISRGCASLPFTWKALQRGCATLHFTWKALQSIFWRHFTWMHNFSLYLVGLAKQLLTLFHVDALLCTPWKALQSSFWRHFTWMR